MSAHALAASTHTVELAQVEEINGHLGTDPADTHCLLVTAEFLGLTGATVHVLGLDRPVVLLLGDRRRTPPPPLPAPARLRRLLAAGTPSYPYLYGLFGEPNGRRELPAVLHTSHLETLSRVLGLRHHRWGV